MVSGPKRHDGTGHGGCCNTFYSGDICFDVPSGGGCTAMSTERAVKFAHKILLLAKEIEDDN